MKKQGFTLAEILISLMILGVIASLTIPSLIQNTQKKEQVVQLKKGLSMINQAVTMHYALTGDDLSTLADKAAVIDMLKKRLSVVAGGGTDQDWVRTQDGLTYYISDKLSGTQCGVTDEPAVNDNSAGTGACYGIVISTKNGNDVTSYGSSGGAQSKVATSGNKALTGYYQFYASADRVVPTSDTQAVMNATDATTVTAGASGS